MSLTPAQSLYGGPALGRDHAAILGASLQAVTDDAGRYAFEAVERDAARTWVLWATHPEFRPQSRRLERSELEGLLAALVLEPGHALRVQVVDSEGRPRAGAELHTFLPDASIEGAATTLAEDQRRSFVRSASSDGQGWATLPPGIGKQHVSARLGELRAAPWYGLAPAEVRLVLCDAVFVSGRVRLLGDAAAREGDDDDLRVTASSLTATLRRTLGRTRVRSDGEWGELALALQEGAELLLRLEGGGVIPLEQRVPFPAAGGRLRVDFDPLRGLWIPVRLLDENADAIHPAQVQAWWQEDGSWIAAQGSADTRGEARLCVRPGSLWFQAQAPGHQAARLDALELRAAPDEPIEIRLARAGRIRGRVTHAGEPVPTYVLKYWGPNQVGAGGHGVGDSADGSFEIEAAPLGEVTLVALATGLPASELQRVEVHPEHPVEVEIELPPARRAHGRIVSAFSGSPIPDARIYTWIKDGTGWIQRSGLEATCDAQGYFLLDALGPGENHFEITAPGHASSHGRLNAGAAAEDVELGLFALLPSQDLTVRVVAAEPLDFSALRVLIPSVTPAREQPLSAQGEAHFQGMLPGSTTVQVLLPDGVRLHEGVNLIAGRPWVVELEVDDAGGAGLEVEVRSAEILPSGWKVRLATSTGRNHWRERHAALVGGRARVPGPFGEHVLLELLDPAQRTWMARRLSAAQALASRVVLELEDEQHGFEVVDARGEPIVGALLIVSLADDRSNWSDAARTDRLGRAELPLPVGAEILLHVRLAGGGGAGDLRVTPPPVRSEVVRVALRTDAHLRARFEDRGAPIQGLAPPLLVPSGYRFLFLGSSAADGVSDSGPIPAGSYRIEVIGQGYWPLIFPVEVRPGANEVTLPIRRLGSLALHVVSAEGVAVSGASCALRSLEFDQEVATWIAQGKVRAPAQGLRSDGEGNLVLSVLPNGSYRYLVQAPDGRTASGELAVPPHARGQVTVSLP